MPQLLIGTGKISDTYPHRTKYFNPDEVYSSFMQRTGRAMVFVPENR